jgi:hypothetical protein
MIENLPLIAPDASRGAQTIARCHARLAARRGRVEARNRPRQPRPAAAERLLAAGVCVIYLIAMARDILAITGAR